MWLTIYCRKPVSWVGSKEILDGLSGRCRTALAGVDYQSLAEDYGVSSDLAKREVSHLAVERDPVGATPAYLVKYGLDPQRRPLRICFWGDPARVKEEISETREGVLPSTGEIPRALDGTIEVVGVEFGQSHLRDSGIVIAFEAARFFAQLGDGIVRDEEGAWSRIAHGAFVPLR
jgi:hypothetical protein